MVAEARSGLKAAGIRPLSKPLDGWTGYGQRQERWYGYFFIAPVFVLLAAVIVFPLGQAFWISLHRTRGLNQSFVGFQNYSRLLADDAFWNSFRVSLAFTSICVVMHIILGL